ncbi:asparagine synthase-related protein [Desulfohalovibrio reitneri]|uniref:asparagine synthase-related protein n=1 Tax=Desulfohalovibrio reitneri TaxID=1307759 RepID=UPI003CC55753
MRLSARRRANQGGPRLHGRGPGSEGAAVGSPRGRDGLAAAAPLRAARPGGKRVLRDLLGGLLPGVDFDRPKQGFAIPLAQWLRGPLRSWCEDLLAESALQRRGLFNAAAVRRVWSEHLSGHRDNGYRLWPVLMFQAWANRHLD